MKITILIACGLLAVIQGKTINTKYDAFKPRIVNGEDAKLGEIPYQVSLQRYESHFCGGSIINEHWVVTAAHCVAWKPTDSISVIAGTIDLGEFDYSHHQSAQIIIHEKYDSDDSWVNDIALIKVAKPFEFSSRIRPVALPESHATIKTNSSVVVSGWGYLNLAGDSTDILQKATLFIADEKVCQAAVRPKHIYPTHVCANDPSTARGDCSGDSGSPLTHNDTLIGIVSWSVKKDGCGSPLYPNVYSRVSEYVDWINEHIK